MRKKNSFIHKNVFIKAFFKQTSFFSTVAAPDFHFFLRRGGHVLEGWPPPFPEIFKIMGFKSSFYRRFLSSEKFKKKHKRSPRRRGKGTGPPIIQWVAKLLFSFEGQIIILIGK